MNIPVETLLLERGLLTERQLRRAMEFRERCPDKALEEILLDFGYVSEAALLACLGERDGLEVVDLSEYKVDPEAAGLISHNFSDQYQVLPIGIRNGKLVVAARDPVSYTHLDVYKRQIEEQLRYGYDFAVDPEDSATLYYHVRETERSGYRSGGGEDGPLQFDGTLLDGGQELGMRPELDFTGTDEDTVCVRIRLLEENGDEVIWEQEAYVSSLYGEIEEGKPDETH